jgi:Glutamine amidotransferase domain
MGGLVGIGSRDGVTASSRTELEALACAYERLRPGPTRDHASAGDLGGLIRFRDDGDAELVPAGDGSWVLCSGTAHDPEGSGGTDVEKLDGQFVWAHYDGARGKLQVANDPFGMRSLFVAERRGSIYFSTSALALAAHLRARPSRLGVEVFLRTGFHFGALTNWEGIERLDPATRITITTNGARRETYWAPDVDESITALELDDAVEHCLGVATETYRATYPAGAPRAWADLTGGWDSRLMTALLADSGVGFITNTAGDERSPDVRVASRVANAVGWEWHRFDIPRDWREVMPGLVPLALAWGDCHLDALQLCDVLWGHIEKARRHTRLFTGGGGEHFRDRAWQQEFFNGGRSRRVNFNNYVDMRLLKPLDTSVFALDPTSEVRDDMLARMRARAQPYAQHLNTTQLDVMHAYKNTGHFGAYLSAAAAIMAAELPYYLKPVFTAAFSTSHRHRGSHRLMRRMLYSLDQRLAAAETEAGGPASPMTLRNAHRFIPYYTTLARRASRKLSQRAPWPLLTPQRPVDPARAQARLALVASLEDGRPLRHETMRSAALYRRDTLNALLERAGDPNLGGAAGLLGRIITVELALRSVDAGIEDYVPGLAVRASASAQSASGSVERSPTRTLR